MVVMPPTLPVLGETQHGVEQVAAVDIQQAVWVLWVVPPCPGQEVEAAAVMGARLAGLAG